MIYIISEAQWDPLENRNDFWYKQIGYVVTKGEAEAFVQGGGRLRGDETWSLAYKKEPPMRYRYEPLERFVLAGGILGPSA